LWKNRSDWLKLPLDKKSKWSYHQGMDKRPSTIKFFFTKTPNKNYGFNGMTHTHFCDVLAYGLRDAESEIRYTLKHNPELIDLYPTRISIDLGSARINFAIGDRAYDSIQKQWYYYIDDSRRWGRL
jgi:hypothetical protein